MLLIFFALWKRDDRVVTSLLKKENLTSALMRVTDTIIWHLTVPSISY